MRKHMRNLLLTLPVAAVVTLASCEGENLFPGPGTGNEDAPEILLITANETVAAGGLLTVNVSGTSTVGVSEMEIDLSRGVVQDTTRVFDPPEEDFTSSTQFTMPQNLTQQTVRIRVILRDRFGAESDPEELEVPVSDTGLGASM